MQKQWVSNSGWVILLGKKAYQRASSQGGAVRKTEETCPECGKGRLIYCQIFT